jgi:hypothetical protein
MVKPHSREKHTWKLKHPDYPRWIIIKFKYNPTTHRWHPHSPKKYREMPWELYLKFESECTACICIGFWK